MALTLLVRSGSNRQCGVAERRCGLHIYCNASQSLTRSSSTNALVLVLVRCTVTVRQWTVLVHVPIRRVLTCVQHSLLLCRHCATRVGAVHTNDPIPHCNTDARRDNTTHTHAAQNTRHSYTLPCAAQQPIKQS